MEVTSQEGMKAAPACLSYVKLVYLHLSQTLPAPPLLRWLPRGKAWSG